MGMLEIILLAAGAVLFIASFCVPVKQEKLKEEAKNLAAEEVKSLVSEELEHVRGHLSELSEEEIQQQIEKSERSMERISNEKIMAVNEYSDTVLEEIHKNHEEVVFLYEMLKSRKESLTESYGKAEQGIQELLQQVKDAEITVREKLAELSDKRAEAERNKKRSPSAAERKEPEKGIFPAEEPAGRQTAVSALEMLRGKVAESRAKEAENSAFEPFVPEKVEVVPKKKTSGKTQKAEKEQEEKGGQTEERKEAKEQKTEKSPAGETPPEAVPDKESEKKTSFSEEEEMMLLLSETMEKGQANSNERILELHRAGKSNMAIARELGLGIGEVKLVIDLYEGLR